MTTIFYSVTAHTQTILVTVEAGRAKLWLGGDMSDPMSAIVVADGYPVIIEVRPEPYHVELPETPPYAMLKISRHRLIDKSSLDKG